MASEVISFRKLPVNEEVLYNESVGQQYLDDLTQVEPRANSNWYFYLVKPGVLTGFYPAFLTINVKVEQLGQGDVFRIKFFRETEPIVQGLIADLEFLRQALIRNLSLGIISLAFTRSLWYNYSVEIGPLTQINRTADRLNTLIELIHYLGFGIKNNYLFSPGANIEVLRPKLFKTVQLTYSDDHEVPFIENFLTDLQIGGKPLTKLSDETALDQYIKLLADDGTYIYFRIDLLIAKSDYFKCYFGNSFTVNRTEHETNYSFATLVYFWRVLNNISNKVNFDGPALLEQLSFANEYLLFSEKYALDLFQILLYKTITGEISYKFIKQVYDLPQPNDWKVYNSYVEEIYHLFHPAYLRSNQGL